MSKTLQSPKVIVGQRARSQSGRTVKTTASGSSGESVISKATIVKKSTVVEGIREIARPSLRSSSSGEQSIVVIHKVPKRLGWVMTAILMVAETMSLGIMSLPNAMNTLGLIIGPLLILFFGLLSFFCGLLLCKVKQKYPQIGSYCDMMSMMYGRYGKVFTTASNGIMLIFVMAGHIITFTDMVKAWAGVDTPCLVIIKAVAALFMAALSLPKLLRSSIILYCIAAVSIITAAFILMIDGGVTHTALGSKAAFLIVPLRLLDFAGVASTISNVMVSYAGHMAYFQIMDEMENVNDFWKSLSLASVIITVQYTLIAAIVYIYYGQDVASPALSSASPLIGKITWTISIPTILVAGVIAAQILNKDIMLLRWGKQQTDHDVQRDAPLLKQADPEKGLKEGQEHESSKPSGEAPPTISGKLDWTRRILVDLATWSFAFLLANVIPGFNNLLALLGALVGWSIVIGQPSLMWLWQESEAVRCEETKRILWKQSIKQFFHHKCGNKVWFYFCVSMVALWPVAAITGVVGSCILINRAGMKEGVFLCKAIAS